MSWNLPSLTALRILEAVARHRSFTRAALELHITQSAVSRQVRILEEFFRVRLFDRTQQSVTLTAAGAKYLDGVRGSLEKIQDATIDLLTGQNGGGTLNLATPPAFGTRWLIPRLHRFQQQNPDIILNLVTRNAIFDFKEQEIDAAFHYGNNDWPGVVSVRLTGNKLVLVGAPSYLGRIRPIRSPQDVVGAVMLQPIRRPNLWRDWLLEAGIEHANSWAGPRFEHYYMIIQAALAGLGLAILPRLIITEELKSGRLVDPLGKEFTSPDCYCLVYPQAKENDVALRQFRKWTKDEASL